MGGRWWVAASVCAFAVGCVDRVEQPTSPDALVLELGGSHGSLEAALRQVDARAPRPRDAIAPMVEGVDQERPLRARASPPPAAIAPEPRSVELREGQTISELSAEHLGTSRRWREILELNGWDEVQARALPVGTKVRLPEN
jgi:hypothetical protein